MDEFNALKSEAPAKHHPEDDSESASEPDSDSENVRLNRAEKEEDGRRQTGGSGSIPGTGDRDMMFNHSSHLSGSFQTGVKGVLSDAISYESALRKEKSQKSTNSIHTGYSQSSSSPPKVKDRNSDGESGEDDFVKTWRKNRMQELKTGQSNTRRRSPSKRKYGRVEVVDAVGYLDAVERVSSETVVVVTIYNDKSEESRFVEDCLNTLARRYVTTRFVKLHHTEAEMDVAVVPAVLAYKGGELFANIIRIVDEIPSGRSLSTDSLELVLRRLANVLHKD
ncbi:thioredoxin-like protein [Choiromyces venosus 120613-1]|uniref:Thioredoxin-like protein n=1 Tax=Choiromyces venosus 120613-1 TaxID=1336337 RepID=A0A3N4JN15_9PEZI|nr:thioredoxin-like protein [Choiromyces venosus 120613-1]